MGAALRDEQCSGLGARLWDEQRQQQQQQQTCLQALTIQASPSNSKHRSAPHTCRQPRFVQQRYALLAERWQHQSRELSTIHTPSVQPCGGAVQLQAPAQQGRRSGHAQVGSGGGRQLLPARQHCKQYRSRTQT